MFAVIELVIIVSIQSNEIVSYTLCRDTAISPRSGITLSPTHVALAPMLSHLTELLFMITTTTIAQLNKLPLTSIIVRIIDGTICFDNHNIQTHVLGSICLRRDGD